MADSKALADSLQQRFADQIEQCSLDNGEVTIEVAPRHLIEVCRTLRDRGEFRFEQLIDLCGVDYLSFGQDEWKTDTSTFTGFSRGVNRNPGNLTGVTMQGPRFAVVYHLLSVANNHRLRIKTFCEDNEFPMVDSVVNIWNGANWFEREAFDLYGIVFEGHPDLRRILSDYGFIGHPFRKDYPLSGYVEVRYDPEKQRVIYQPVSIEPRVLVPKVIRDDHRYLVEPPEENAPDA